MRDVVILSAARTPMGAFGGSYRPIPAPDLAAGVMARVVEESGIQAQDLDEIMLGNVYAAGIGPNLARLAAHRAGLPETIPASTLNQLCGSGLRAVALGAQALAAGSATSVLVGGAECMSQVPYLLPEARWGRRVGSSQARDGLLQDGLECPLAGQRMGDLAEALAQSSGFSRRDLEAWALRSQEGAVAHHAARQRELRLVAFPGRGKDPLQDDESIRPGLTPARLAELAPAFRPEGWHTAATASPMSDGAAALVLASQGPRPRAFIRGFAMAAGDPRDLVDPVVRAIHRVLEPAGLSLAAVEAVELNEAFAAQILETLRRLPTVDPARVNVRGGALALGHPVGATGTRLVVTLLHRLEDHGQRWGLAALCVGGGQGMALLLERP